MTWQFFIGSFNVDYDIIGQNDARMAFILPSALYFFGKGAIVPHLSISAVHFSVLLRLSLLFLSLALFFHYVSGSLRSRARVRVFVSR